MRLTFKAAAFSVQAAWSNWRALTVSAFILLAAVSAAGTAGCPGCLPAARQDRITIVVSHRAWTLKSMDRTYVFDQGKIVESGPFDYLLSNGRHFASLFRQQTLPNGVEPPA